ncbi:hypothetical protein NW762_005842 [Fusarium torreyae]|uniref:RING-type domain-containing protein n=1 Tax=Fusarium torreyae TaxID=1237075 RepID=A0A9W8VI63_9HYPO|nr:hypothetical protein NW762_005842 [Fusarium torreyae]
MRPPRVFVLILFIAASLLLFCRAISSSLRSAYADYPAGNFRSKPKTDNPSSRSHDDDSPKSTKSVWGSMYYNTPFSLFPPNAAISLTDDNSTSFAARPAAFGPKLAARGLSGQLWVGSGFAEDALIHGTGELGCSDTPGWTEKAEAIALHKALRAAVPSVATSRTDSSARAKRAGRVIIPNAGNGHTTSSHVPATHDHSEIDGKVALLMRGGCGFLDKVMWAQRRGALAVIVGDNQKGGPLIQMFAHGPEVDNVTIPSVFTARTTAQLLSALTQPGSFIEDTLDNQGNPVLRVQRGPPKSKKNKKQGIKSTITASTHDRRSLDNTRARSAAKPVSRKRRTSKVPKKSVTRKNKVVRESPKDIRSPLLSEDNYDEWTHGSSSRKLKPVIPAKAAGRDRTSDDNSMTEEEEEILVEFLTEDEDSAPILSNDRPDERFEVPDEADDDAHDGLWVTIIPTSNASPFFDTLLVLVISPLVTLTVVYALLILRARIRRRRWRAPKSVVERLPVRTYHTVAPSPTLTPRAPSPSEATPTTPLLQDSPTRPRPRSRNSTGLSEDETRSTPSDAIPTPPNATRNNARSEREKGSGGFSAEWKKYMGRQVECVVCLEEYVDGVSQVMSLPCGHEFHVECITPWLTTRRRTCPICKGDVVRSLAHGSSSEPHYEPYRDDASDDEDDDEEETIAEGSGSRSDDRESDLEQGLMSNEARSSRWSRHDGWLGIFSNGLGRARSPSPEDRNR